ncbi:MAG: hypothetical protein DME22_23710 [Verrucomicrobia bacterium]|nr:MAG: hypothetical protein DME22_23710 [Verrucomicrobiota bacterium]
MAFGVLDFNNLDRQKEDMRTKNFAGSILTLFLFGCAAPREVLYDTTKREPTTTVEVFREGNKPAKQYKELGEIAYEDFGGEEPKVLREMIARAKRLGADGIIMQPRQDTGYHFNLFGRSGNKYMYKSIALFTRDTGQSAEPIGGANGDEPFRSVSTSTSVSAHPRRSPLTLDE